MFRDYHPLRMQLYGSFYHNAADDFLFHSIIRRDETCFTPAGAFTIHNPHERGFEVGFSVNTWDVTVSHSREPLPCI